MGADIGFKEAPPAAGSIDMKPGEPILVAQPTRPSGEGLDRKASLDPKAAFITGVPQGGE